MQTNLNILNFHSLDEINLWGAGDTKSLWKLLIKQIKRKLL